MRQAITTKFHGPTNYRGSRVTAYCQSGKLTISWDHALDSSENHKQAACALCAKLGWEGKLVQGGLPDGTGDVFVFVEDVIRIRLPK